MSATPDAPASATTGSDAANDTAPDNAPEVIQFRAIWIAFAGAEDAAPSVTRTREQAQARAQLMADMARGGDEFAGLAARYSEHSDAAGTAGLFKVTVASPGAIDPAVVEAAVRTAVATVSAPVDTSRGYVVVQRLPDPPTGPEEIAARHILIGYAGSPQQVAGATRTEAEARALAEEIAIAARQPDADWNALAAEYTDEPGSDQTGGDLGTFTRGRMVRAFERAAFSLGVGEISGVVQSPFGFHVIQRYQ